MLTPAAWVAWINPVLSRLETYGSTRLLFREGYEPLTAENGMAGSSGPRRSLRHPIIVGVRDAIRADGAEFERARG